MAQKQRCRNTLAFRDRKGGIETLHVTKEPTRPIEQECFESLACAIVERAAEDYALALRGRVKYDTDAQRYPRSMEAAARYMKQECKRFFLSGWCMILCDIDGKRIMQAIEDEYKREEQRREALFAPVH